VSAETTALASNKAVLRRHFEEVLNEGLLDVIDEIYTEGYVLDAPVQPDGSSAAQSLTKGRDGLKKRAIAFRTAFPDIHFTINTMLAEGDLVSVHYTFRGTHRATFLSVAPAGNVIDISGMIIARLINNQIDSAWSVFDSGHLLHQLQAS
jgi:predicted ester cyclase